VNSMKTKNIECSFCKELKNHKELKDYYSKPGYKTEYTAALVSCSYYEDRFCGQLVCHGYKLNFCPECGKELNEPKIEEINN